MPGKLWTPTSLPDIAVGDVTDPSQPNALRDLLLSGAAQFDGRPVTGNALDDEFDTTLDLVSKWNWVGAGAPSGGTEDAGASGGSLFVVLNSDTASGAAFNTDAHVLINRGGVPLVDVYDVTCKLFMTMDGSNAKCGLYFDDDPSVTNAPADDLAGIWYGTQSTVPRVAAFRRAAPGAPQDTISTRDWHGSIIWLRARVDTLAQEITTYASVQGGPEIEMNDNGALLPVDTSGWNGGRPQRMGLAFWANTSLVGYADQCSIPYFRVEVITP